MTYRTIRTLLQPCNLDFSELEDLSSMAKYARAIGIGEGAHFVSEFSLARASFIRYFVEMHEFNAIGLECGAVQGNRISEWLKSSASTDKLKEITNPLTFALYGSVLTWLKSYLLETGKSIMVVGVDLPNTLNPLDDLQRLSAAIDLLDPILKPDVDALIQSLESICGESPVISSAQWGELGTAKQDQAFSRISRLKLRLSGLEPILVQRGGKELFQRASECVCSIEHTLETLRTMKMLFDGTSLDGDTSVREVFTATTVERFLHADPDFKILLLAHNNHIQKTSVSFSGELTAIPMGQQLAYRRKDYRAIGATHLGGTVPEMQYPSPDSPLGFSVEPTDADKIQRGSVEQHIMSARGVAGSCLMLSDDVKGASRVRSQSSSVETNVSDAFDAIFCVPSANQDKLVEL
ncbi:erythromycin esterase family protein [Klebsiella pneumoniae]|uniref:erythromycin esterase family protein n=1 Tax=Klebsiella pneumoniae TaxID=573 RepID=UPI00255246AE|nr:erythromycin esterase family protein [Klebsiella pneumoniae]MEC5588722.1 erythromycin esterase family protein [Klebsiella pneumoniae]